MTEALVKVTEVHVNEPAGVVDVRRTLTALVVLLYCELAAPLSMKLAPLMVSVPASIACLAVWQA